MDVVSWLLDGDAAVRHQTSRDLLGVDDPVLSDAVTRDGDAAAILRARGTDGHWGRGFYQPKWTSTHYSLLELAGLGVPGDHPPCVESAALCARLKAPDGGVHPVGAGPRSDACVNGMFLTYAARFRVGTDDLASVVDFLLANRMGDGGFNCRANRARCRVSSVHTTASAIEGLAAYLDAAHPYRAGEVRGALAGAVGCLLERSLYQRRTTGEPIRPDFLKLHYPARWHFDVLRGLEVIRRALPYVDVPVAPLVPALDVVRSRRRPDGTWAAASGWPGETHVTYPRAGTANRWVTLRALRVLGTFAPASVVLA